MNYQYENQGSSIYLVAELPLETEVDTMTLGMITNNTIPGVARAVYTQQDTARYVKFNVTARISLKQLLEGAINRHRLAGVFLGICNALQNADDYMLDRSSFLYDVDKIFVNVSTLEVSMICVPVVQLIQQTTDVAMLFKSIMFSAQFDTTENTDYVGKIINSLNNPAGFLLEEFRVMLEEMEREEVNPVQKQEKAEPFAERQTPTSAQSAIAVQNAALPQGAAPARNAVPLQNVAVNPGAAPGEPPVPVPQGKEKKGFGLFGGKASKESKPEKKAGNKHGKKAQPMAHMAIPGAQQTIPRAMPQTPPPPGPQPSFAQTPPTAAPPQVVPPQTVAPRQNSQPMPVHFGETMVLDGGAVIGETTVLGINPAPVAQPYLIRIRTDEHIPLTKPIFRVGKEKNYVDYFVSDNSAVSRSHANFVLRDGKVYVIDTNSTNHTFVDNRQIESNRESELVHGTRIRLADEEFEFRAY